MFKTRLAALVIGLLCAFTAQAQQEATFGERIEVGLVLVDVLVEDAQGNPVLDLTAKDFRLFEDRSPVEIRYFTPPEGATPAGDEGTVERFEPSPRRVVIFVDELHLVPSNRKRVFDKLIKQLDDYLDPADEVMVATYGGTTVVELEMTTDRRELKNKLRELSRADAISLVAANEERGIIEAISGSADTFNIAPSAGFDSHCRDVGFLAQAHAQQSYSRVVGAIGELNRFVNSLAGYEGPKMLLHISDGMPMVPGTAAFRYASELCDGTGANKGIRNATDTTLDNQMRSHNWDPSKTSATLREFDTSRDWMRLASHANTNQVSFYMYQAEQQGLRASGTSDSRMSFDVESEEERNRQDPLLILAGETGGVATLGSNDIEPALRRMNDDARYSYQLAFEPASPGDGRQHKIRVEVERPKTTLRYRKSYLSKSRQENIGDRVLSALLHGRSTNPLAVDLKLSQADVLDSATSNVDVRLEIPMDELVLLPDGDAQRGLFTVYMVVRNGFGQLTPIGHKTIPLALPADEPRTDYVYTVSVPVRGDSGTVAVAVHDELGAEVSYLRKEVTLPRS